MTAEQATDVLLMLKACFPHGDKGLDERAVLARQTIWQRAIERWAIGPAMDAVERVALSCKYAYPSLGELHEAYAEANRPTPERSAISNALPAHGHTTASPEEIIAACAEAVAIVERNAVVQAKRVRIEGTPARVLAELERIKGTTMLPPEMRDGKAEGAGS